MMELAKFPGTKGSLIKIYVEENTGRLSLHAFEGNFFDPADFIEIADAMKRAANAAGGIKRAWAEQQAAISKANNGFQESVKKIL